MMATRVKPKTVEEYLNEINYTSRFTHYQPSQFAIKFIAFLQMCSDGKPENKSPLIHYEVADKFDNGSSRIANLMHRGIAKTTLIRHFILFIATFHSLPNFGDVGLALYISDSIENGVKNMRKNLEYQYENSEFLRTVLPKASFTDVRWEFTNAKGQVTVIKGYGAKTGVRGVTELNQRPTMAFLDDLLSDEDARSDTVIKSINDTVHKAIKFALHPKRYKIIWNGTPFHENDPLYRAVESGAWEVNVYPVCEKFPCTREEFRGSWEDRFNYDYVKEEYDAAIMQGQVSAFNQELMLRIMSDEDRLIADSEILWYEPKYMRELLSSVTIGITTDWATSEKQSADYSGAMVWGMNHNQDIFLIDGYLEKCTMDKNINRLFEYVRKYNPMKVGIEVSGQQGGFIPWIRQEMIRNKVYFSLASSNNDGNAGIKPTTNKLQRFNVVVPWFKAGKMYFPEHLKDTHLMLELMNEIRLASPEGFKSMYDDGLDNISQIPLLGLTPPSMDSFTPTLSNYSRGVFQEDIIPTVKPNGYFV